MSKDVTETDEPGDFSFEYLHNDDLLVHEAARAEAQRAFPTILHVLDNPELRARFTTVDRKANLAKRRSHGAGMLAVTFAMFALAISASEALWHRLPASWPKWISISSAIFALVGVWLATFVCLYGRRKEDWLQCRLYTESLRQLHFQSLIWNLGAIARSTKSETAAADFRARRARFLAEHDIRLRGSLEASLAAILDPNSIAMARMTLAESDGDFNIPRGFDPGPLFKAYKSLRFEAQIAFADFKLREGRWQLDPRRMSLRMQLQQFRFIWGGAVTLLVLAHVLVIASVLTDQLDGPWLHISIAWIALLALGIKTLQEGLGLASEIARYEAYRAEVRDLMVRFENVIDAKEKLNLMSLMEDAAYREMRDFLRIHHEARFVI